MREEPAEARGAHTPPSEGAHSPPPETAPTHHEVGHDRPGHVHSEGEAPAHGGNGDRLIRPSESDELRRRWESIQASFIDAPRESVEEADHLVSELTDRIAERFRSERSNLEENWSRGDEVSTEDLRVTLQRYRGFFDRLLRL